MVVVPVVIAVVGVVVAVVGGGGWVAVSVVGVVVAIVGVLVAVVGGGGVDVGISVMLTDAFLPFPIMTSNCPL